MSALVERIEKEGRALSQRVLADMYRDPFWTERYGDRGRRHADEDSDFHLRYLARALEAGDAAVLVRYAAWLREVLATRGMCTRHLDENFRLLSRAIAAQPWPDRERAVAFLERAREALLYPAGEARELQARIDTLADAIAKAFDAGRWKRGDARGAMALRDDAANYLSYVADALAFGKPDTLVAHTRWFASHLRSHGVEGEAIAAFLGAVRGALQSSGPAPRALAFVDEAAALP